MAHLAQLIALTNDLVDAVAAIPQTERARLERCRESALRGVRNQAFLRTNQFDIENHLNGLEERFRVIGREALADALRERLDALETHRNKWTPEVLHFILELSDQPAQKSNLSDLDLLYEPEEIAGPKLTWKDIAKEDGWHQDRAIWRTIDYSPSSDDELYEDGEQSERSDESLSTISFDDEPRHRTAQEMAVECSGGDLLVKQVQDSQTWRYVANVSDAGGRAKKIPLASSQLLREVLFMLGNLETSLFNSQCELDTSYQLAGVSWPTYKALATSFAECGRKLAPLRSFVTKREQIPLLQVFQGSLQKVLHSFDSELAACQSRFVAPKLDAVVSLVTVLSQLEPWLTPLYVLSRIVQELQTERNPHAFRYLELLYDAVGTAQLEGSQASYKLLGGLFFDCFQVYLKPIRMWMEDGRLLPGDRTFFVSESSTKLPLHQIWKSQFNLLRTPDGTLHAPRFLRPAIDRIFTTGKSIVVLKHLKHYELARNRRAEDEPQMDFATVCPDELEFAPFSELFNTAFNAWIQSKHHTASATLRELLFNSYGLSQGLDALERLYLMSDGSASDTFASAVFRHLDSFSSSWKDRFTLTEIAQEAFSLCDGVDAYRLSADVTPIDHSRVTQLAGSAAALRSSVRKGLPAIQLRYRLPWPVQVIIPEEAVVQGYQSVFTLLLQTRRALSLLRHPLRHSSVGGDGGGVADHHHNHPSHLARYYLLHSKLWWFCTTVMTYLTSIVLTPATMKLRQGLRDAVDVDDMIAVHADFAKRIVAESCLGAKLEPIRDGVLDIFDLAVRLEDAHAAEMARRDEEDNEISRLSVMSSPYQSPAKWTGGKPRVRRKTMDDDEDDSDVELDRTRQASMMNRRGVMGGGAGIEKSHTVKMRELHADFERHLRFVTAGLRGAARASRDEAATKWDLLAEMLEVGVHE